MTLDERVVEHARLVLGRRDDRLGDAAQQREVARNPRLDVQQPWEANVDDYDRIRDTMAQALDGFDDFNERVRRPRGFRIRQPARERVFLTPSERAEFSSASLPATVPAEGRLTLGTLRSHDQWNTTIYSNNDRYRGLRNLRTVVFMNTEDMRERQIDEFDLVDVTSIAKDSSRRSVYS
ncbi:MAG: putative oxidoreductase [Actinomycetia bacterium]|nr:putative oxidoreductase [Actinomycetes bacterium]